MDIYILVATLTVTSLLGGLVALQAWHTVHGKLFVVMVLAIVSWIISNYITNHSVQDIGLANSANKLAFASGYGIVVAAVFFTYIFPSSVKAVHYEKLAVLIVSASVIMLCFGEFISGSASIENGVVHFAAGSGVGIYLVAFLALVVLITLNLTVRMRHVSKEKRALARIISFAFVSAATIGLLLNVLLPILFNDNTATSTRFGPLVIIVLVATIAYAIVRHRMFDIKTALLRSFVYILSIATLGAAYFMVAYVISTFFAANQYNSEIAPSFINLILAFSLALIFQPVKAFFDKITSNIFFRNRYDPQEFYARLSQTLAATTDLRDMLRRASEDIATTFKSSQAFFFVTYNATHHISAGTPQHHTVPKADVVRLDKYVAKHGDDLVVSELLPSHSHERRLLLSHKIYILMPLRQNDMMVGYLALGEHRASGYTHRDIRTLETISDELIIAIQNAVSVQEAKDINATLQQRIDAATAELRSTNARLTRIDNTKDEFLSMASHQLRTPLTSIKGYLSMILEGDIGKVSNAQRQVLEEAFTSSERMVHLIHDFLNVSRLQTGKFVLEEHEYDVAKLVREEIKSLARVAKTRDMELAYSTDIKSLPMTCDETKLRQVIINFIDNAIYYSPVGGTIRVALSRTNGKLEFTVKDDGIGVPINEQSQLFGKFYRASNARKQRPDGTGVGLFLAHKVITAHGGDVIFESRAGKGSTFGFWLPLQNDADQLDNQPHK